MTRSKTKKMKQALPRGDRPFQVLERINDNAYKIDIPSDDSEHFRANAFQEEGNDENPKTAQI